MANGSAQEGRLLGTLKSVAQFLGVVGGGGAGFAALAFGIGYLATKHHDAMMGMPTTTTDNSSYVRNGALFFSQSLHDLAGAIAAAGSSVVWVVVIGATVAALTLLLQKSQRLSSWWHHEWFGWFPLLAASVGLLVLSLAYLPRHLAPLDPGNKNLLFEERDVSGHAKEVNALLRSVDGEQELHRLYGRQWLSVLALGLGAFVLHHWRRPRPPEASQSAADGESGGADGTSVPLAAIDWLLHPALYAVIVALLVSMPANYGVLAMSTSLPCGRLYTAPGRPMGDAGFLVSDLSSEAAVIGILRRDGGSYFVDLHPRADMHQIEVRGCLIRNPVSWGPVVGSGRPGPPPK